MVQPSVPQFESLLDQGAEPFRQLLQESLQHLLEGQMTEFIGATPGERTQARTGYRAGHVTRRLTTCAGLLELRVPRDRAKRFSTDLLERYPHQEAGFVAALGEVAAQGLTAAKVGALAEALCGHALSAQALGQIQEGLHDALARHGRGAGSVDVDVDDGDGAGEAARESRVSCRSAARTQSGTGSGPSVDDATPAAVAQKGPAPAEGKADAAADCAPPVAPDLDAFSFAPRLVYIGRVARWMAGLCGTLVAAGLLLMGMRLMEDVAPEPTRAAADFSVPPGHGVHAVHAVHMGRVDPVDSTPAIGQPSPAAPERAALPRQISHFQLTGTVAASPADGDGLALIAIDGGLTRVIRVGASVDGELSLQAVSADRAMLGPMGGPPTVVLELGTSAGSPRGVLRAEGGQRSWAGAVATAPASYDAETTQPPAVLASSMPPSMTMDAGALQPTAAMDLVPAAVPAGKAEFQSLSQSERRRLRKLNLSR